MKFNTVSTVNVLLIIMHECTCMYVHVYTDIKETEKIKFLLLSSTNYVKVSIPTPPPPFLDPEPTIFSNGHTSFRLLKPLAMLCSTFLIHNTTRELYTQIKTWTYLI